MSANAWPGSPELGHPVWWRRWLFVMVVLAAGVFLAAQGCQKDVKRSGQADASARTEAAETASAAEGPKVAPPATEAPASQPVAGVPSGQPAAAPAVPADVPATPGQPGATRPNRAPQAAFEALPPQGYANMTSLQFNSSLSTDEVDLSSQLRRRWDFDGDGKWDTGFLKSEYLQWTYKQAGHFRPRLLVTDTGGLSDTCVGSELTILDPCPAPDFALEDINPASVTKGHIYRRDEFRGKPLVVWFAAPSK
jgi:hypothetical protein